jgi:hypothetical protein
MKKVCLIALCVFFVSGCAVQKYNFDEPESGKKIVHEQRQDFYAFYLIPSSRQIVAQKYCEVDDLKQIETLLAMEDVLSGNFISSFKSFKVHCGSV